MPGFILDAAYCVLLLVASPLILYRMLRHGKYRPGWSQKLLGLVPRRPSRKPCLWFHAVSIGEVLLLETVLRQLLVRLPHCEFAISTTTDTGFDVARKKYPECRVFYFPLDFTWAVKRTLARIAPQAVVLVELELWPNFVHAAAGSGIPVMLINGRISEKSFRGYRRIGGVVRPLLRSLSALAVQNDTYARRFIALGAEPAAVHVTGSVKFDRVQSDPCNSATLALRRFFGLRDGERVFIAGSTQHPEEQFALDAYSQLEREFPDLRLVLVPRHKERFEDVAQLVLSRGLPLMRRSRGDAVPPEGKPVLLLDTLGELSACWGLADVAFVGGSLTRRGGQNMIEPSAFGAAVCFGPHTQNFKDVVEALLNRQAARVVADEKQLTEIVRDFLRDPKSARECGRRARDLVLEQQGATDRMAGMIVDALSRLSEQAAKAA